MTTTTASHDSNTAAGNAPACTHERSAKPAEFTPGPWSLGIHRTNPRNFVKIEARDSLRVICDAFSYSDEDYANANLIASAPELLAACEAAEYWLTAESERPGQATPDEILRILRAALAKAAAA